MRPITIMRAVAWVGVAVAGWSLTLYWGDDIATGKGPPVNWERHVVGAAILSGLAALALSVSGRGSAPPSWIARGVALVSSLGAVGLALFLRHQASSRGFDHLLAGHGWTWMLSGSGLALAAAVAAAGLKPAEERKAADRPAKKRGGKRRR